MNFKSAALILFFASSANATTLQDIVISFAVPANESYTANDWASNKTIPGVKWSHEGLRQTPMSAFTRSGTTTLKNHGQAEVFFSGARTMVTELDITISEAKGKIFEKEDFYRVLKSQFKPNVAITKIRGGCDGDGALSGDEVYEIKMPQKKSVYVLISTDSGGSSTDSRSSGFQFSLSAEERWACQP